jgi:macrolide-specific efflux system membrane fusion protein
MANTEQTTSNSSLSTLKALFIWRPWQWIVLLLIGAVAYYFLMPLKSDQVTSVARLSVVTRGDIENTVTAAGKLTSKDWVAVGAQVSGQLDIISVEIGDVVKKDQLLAEIDATVQVARVNASRASLNALKSQKISRESKLRLAKLTAERQGRMMKDKATSEQEYDKAENALIEAEASLLQLKAQIAQSEASLSSQEAELGYTTIYAPMNGTVVSIVAKEGQTLNANNQAPTILTIADLTVMTVEAEVSEADIGKLKKNMEVYFSTLGGGNRRWHSRVRQILPTPTVSNNVVLYTVLFDIDNADSALLSQMTAQVFFVTSSARNVVSIPVGALTYLDDKRGVNKASGLTDEERKKSRASRDKSKGEGRGKREGKGRNRKGNNAKGPTSFDGLKPRRASVQREVSKGIYETVEVKVGVTSRISAEVISGLGEGDRVVSGIIQYNAAGDTKEDRRNNKRIPRGF